MVDIQIRERDSSLYTPKKVENLFLFDWDDTLLPHTVLATYGLRLDNPTNISPELEEELRQLESKVFRLLSMAVDIGRTCIITNAEAGWVQMSAEKFFPNILPLFSQIEIISARTTYQSQYPGSPHEWKLHACRSVLNLSSSEIHKNVLVFGDSVVEIEAAHAATKPLTNTRTKSLKFLERPNLSQLRQQIELVMKYLESIINYEGSIDLFLSL